MTGAALRWGLTTRAGRALTWAGVVLAIGLALVIYGARRERQKQAVEAIKATVRSLETRNEVQADVEAMGADGRDDALARWVRD